MRRLCQTENKQSALKEQTFFRFFSIYQNYKTRTSANTLDLQWINNTKCTVFVLAFYYIHRSVLLVSFLLSKVTEFTYLDLYCLLF